jgi:hypothetical protein
MTIDDELILELIKPNKFGEVGEGALLVKVVGTRNLHYSLEQPTTQLTDIKTTIELEYALTHIITPDITVILPKEEQKEIAIELENDVHWDFGESLRQIKKYKNRFKDVRVIIPEEYRRFAPLYKNESFRVFLWKAKRRWQCLRCGTETIKEGPVTPKCSNPKCNSNNPNEFRLIGLKDADVEEYI